MDAINVNISLRHNFVYICVCCTGAKAGIINRIKEFHLQFVILMARPLTPVDNVFVDTHFQLNVNNVDIGNKIVATVDIVDVGDHITSVKVAAREFSELRPAQPLSINFICKIWSLFSKRDSRIAMAHQEINDGKQNYFVYQRSYFLPVAFMRAVQADPQSNNIMQDNFPQGINFSSTLKLYCLDKMTDDGDDFCLMIVDFSLKSFLFLLPSLEFDSYRSAPPAKAVDMANKLNMFLDHRMEANTKAGPWSISSNKFPTVKYPVQQNDFDSGIYAFYFVYYSVFECPIIFQTDDLNRFRKQIAYWILQQYLPI